jgi:hypothetical protein
MRHTLTLTSVLAVFLGAACSSSSGTPNGDGGSQGDGASQSDGGSGNDGSTPADGGTTDAAQDVTPESGGGGDGAPTVCNSIVDVAQTITVLLAGSGLPPTATGGTIVDGTYALTTGVIYGNYNGPSPHVRVAIQITGSTVQIVDDSAATTKTTTATFMAAGTGITATDTCPDANVVNEAYTATSTSLVVEVSIANGATFVETFTKQ